MGLEPAERELGTASSHLAGERSNGEERNGCEVSDGVHWSETYGSKLRPRSSKTDRERGR